MEVLRSYVVRIYRQESDEITGVIESVETGDADPFRSSHELWDVLSRPPFYAAISLSGHSRGTARPKRATFD